MSPKTRLGDEERRLMHLVPAPAVRLMKRRVLSRPGVNSLMVLIFRAREKEKKREGEDDSRLEKEKNHMAAVRNGFKRG